MPRPAHAPADPSLPLTVIEWEEWGNPLKSEVRGGRATEARMLPLKRGGTGLRSCSAALHARVPAARHTPGQPPRHVALLSCRAG